MTLLDELPEAWRPILVDTLNSDAGRKLQQHLIDLLAQGEEIFPPRHAWFSALRGLTPAETRVVIIGQDPYHDRGQATGHAFAVEPSMKTPPSLRNIFKLIERECGTSVSPKADLSRLERQGVMLLNSVLTVAREDPDLIPKSDGRRSPTVCSRRLLAIRIRRYFYSGVQKHSERQSCSKPITILFLRVHIPRLCQRIEAFSAVVT